MEAQVKGVAAICSLLLQKDERKPIHLYPVLIFFSAWTAALIFFQLLMTMRDGMTVQELFAPM